MAVISVSLLVVLIFTCLLSWYVAYGNAALAEMTAARTSLAEAERKVAEAEIAEAASKQAEAKAAAEGDAAGTDGAATDTVAKAEPYIGYCARKDKPARGNIVLPAPPAAGLPRADGGEDQDRPAQDPRAGFAGPVSTSSSYSRLRPNLPEPILATTPRATVGRTGADKADTERRKEKDRASKDNCLLLLADSPPLLGGGARRIMASAVLRFPLLPARRGRRDHPLAVAQDPLKLLSPARPPSVHNQQLALGAVGGRLSSACSSPPQSPTMPATAARSGHPLGLRHPPSSRRFRGRGVFAGAEALIARIFNILRGGPPNRGDGRDLLVTALWSGYLSTRV